MFKTLMRVIDWAGKYRSRLYLGVFFSFLSTWATAATVVIAAWFLGQVLDDYAGEASLAPMTPWLALGAILACVFLRFIFLYWKAKLQESIGYEVAVTQRIKIGDILKRVPLGYFSTMNVGDILTATTTELSVLELQGMKMVDALINGYVAVLAITMCLLFFSPLAALVAVVAVFLSTLALLAMNHRASQFAPVEHRATENLSSAIIEYVRGLPIVKSFGLRGAAKGSITQACHDSKKIHVDIEIGFTPLNCVHLLILKIASICLIAVAASATLSGQMSLSVMIMIALFSFTIFASVESMNDSAHVLGVINDAMDKLELIEQAHFIDEEGEDITLDRFDIKFDEVSFAYDDRLVLQDVDFLIPQGSTCAIVGPSGSGKTTICNLIARFYDVKSGKIEVGGVDVRRMTCDSLMRNISMVFQNPYLFNDTVRNNIAFGKLGATDEEIIDAAKRACCHEFIEGLPDGYDTVIGEGGSSLSGGEKQRISIARALLKEAPIILLDEATASIDPENEHLIQQAISELSREKTVIVIAHRLATIETADQILVVDQGGITQRGTHNELIQQEGAYLRFINIRRRAEDWTIDSHSTWHNTSPEA